MQYHYNHYHYFLTGFPITLKRIEKKKKKKKKKKEEKTENGPV